MTFSIATCLACLWSDRAAGDYTLTTLVSFDGANGSNPSSGLTIDSQGNLYGTTYSGGPTGGGTVFRIDAGTSSFTTIGSFTNATGSGPVGRPTVDALGNVYGTTRNNGANGVGTVFRIDAGTNVITTIASFRGDFGTGSFDRVTLDSRGNIYGTQSTNGLGSLFRIDAGTSVITTIASFNGTNGYYPLGGLTVDSQDNLYGTSFFGGANDRGTVFRIDAGSTTLNTIASFDGTNGASPVGGLTLDDEGNLYGITRDGGVINRGTAYRIDAGTNTITTIASFDDSTGTTPYSNLTLDAQGNLYGTTSELFSNGFGTVFRIDAGSHNVTTLASFDGANGDTPFDGVVIDSQGNLYGTTTQGGAGGLGTVFWLSPQATAVPEPMSVLAMAQGVLALVGTLTFVRRRGRARLTA